MKINHIKLNKKKSVWRTIWAIWYNEIRIEWRSKQTFYLTTSFLCTMVLLFGFLFTIREGNSTINSALIWMVVLFIMLLFYSRTFSHEKESGSWLLLILNASGESIILGKLLFNIMYSLIWVIITHILFIYIMDIEVIYMLQYVVILFLGALGYAAIGTLNAAITLYAGNSNKLFIALSLPMSCPLTLLLVQSTAIIFKNGAPESEHDMFSLLGIVGVLICMNLLLSKEVIQ